LVDNYMNEVSESVESIVSLFRYEVKDTTLLVAMEEVIADMLSARYDIDASVSCFYREDATMVEVNLWPGNSLLMDIALASKPQKCNNQKFYRKLRLPK